MTAVEGYKVWIGNFGDKISEFNLLKIVQKYGKISKFDFLYKKKDIKGPRIPSGCAFVTFVVEEDAKRTIEALNGMVILNKKLSVNWASENSEKHQLTGNRNEKFSKKLPVLCGGISAQKSSAKTQMKIKALEDKLKSMEQSNLEFKISSSGNSKKS